MEGFWEPFGGVTGGIITAIGLYELYSLFKEKLVPSSFVVGVIPDEYEFKKKGSEYVDSIRKWDSLFEVKFEQRVLARKIKNGKDILKLRKMCLTPSIQEQLCREIPISTENTMGIDFVVWNKGHRHGTYRLAVSFDEQRIEILDAQGEPPLVPEGFFSPNPENIRNPDLKKLNPAAPIQNVYRRLGIFGSYLSFAEGSLESGAYDVTHVEVTIPPRCELFCILFNIDHTQVMSKETVYYAQLIRVVRDSVRQESPNKPPDQIGVKKPT